MKKLLLALFLLPFITKAQNDTIYKKDGKIIPCTITLDNGLFLFYKDKKGNQNDIDKKEVANYKQGNELKKVTEVLPTITNSPILNNKDSVTITAELNHFKTCMANYHKQHVTGTVLTFTGIGAGIGTAFLDVDANFKNILYGSSSAIFFIGTIVMIDAHKHFKRASLGVNGNGVTVKYIFK